MLLMLRAHYHMRRSGLLHSGNWNEIENALSFQLPERTTAHPGRGENLIDQDKYYS
jgi:hypothetical protein